MESVECEVVWEDQSLLFINLKFIAENLEAYSPDQLSLLPQDLQTKLIELFLSSPKNENKFFLLTKLLNDGTENLNLQNFANTGKIPFLISGYCSNLKSIIIEDFATSNFIEDILTHCYKLENLQIDQFNYNVSLPKTLVHLSVRQFEANFVTNIIDNCPNLTSIDLSESIINDILLEKIIIGCPKLKSIKLLYCHGISNQSLITIGQRLPKIKCLNISWNETLNTLEPLLHLTKLEEFGMSFLSSPIPATQITRLLSNNKSLHTLYLAGLFEISEDMIRAIGKLSQLQTLVLQLTDNGTNSSEPQHWVCLSNCIELQHLDIGQQPMLRCSEWIIPVLDNLTHLTYLDISGQTIQVNQLVELIPHLPKSLKKLIIPQDQNIIGILQRIYQHRISINLIQD